MSLVTPMVESLAARLKAAKHTVAVAESSAGGLISATLLAVPGASAFFQGGAIIYTGNARENILGVGADAMKGMRASTEAYALLKARTLRQKLGTTWALAETGASGPTGNRYGDAAGHACIAVVGPVERAITVETGDTDREANMWRFTRAALELLDSCLGAAPR